MDRLILCNKCEKNCIIEINQEDKEVYISDSDCEVGKKYVQDKIFSEEDILTTLVRVKGSSINVLSVKSSKPIKKKLWVECSKALSRLYVGAPIKIGDIICKNILNTGVDIISTKNIKKDL